MPDENGSEDTNESASSLRKKYEAALEQNKAITARLAEREAKDLIREKGYKHLTAEDLKDVSLEDLATKAEELETQKAQADAEALRRVLGAKGISGDDLDKAVADIIGSPANDGTQERIAAAGRIEGAPVGTNKFEGKSGKDLLYAAYGD